MPANGILCFMAHNTQSIPSHFPGIKLIVSPTGCFSVVVDGQQIANVSGLLLNRNTIHSVSVSDTNLMIFYIDGNSALQPMLLAQLGNRAWLDISQRLTDKSIRLPVSPMSRVDSDLVLEAKSMLQRLFPAPPARATDSRERLVDNFLHYIHSHIQQPISLTDLAPLAKLSGGRTRHLFAEQMGMPFSQYVIWMRLKCIIQQILIQQQPLGEMAKQYGFFDPSHFSRHFKRFLGVKPHSFFKSTYQFLPR